jgi:hypothetical protein
MVAEHDWVVYLQPARLVQTGVRLSALPAAPPAALSAALSAALAAALPAALATSPPPSLAAPFALGPIDHDQLIALVFAADLVVTW